MPLRWCDPVPERVGPLSTCGLGPRLPIALQLLGELHRGLRCLIKTVPLTVLCLGSCADRLKDHQKLTAEVSSLGSNFIGCATLTGAGRSPKIIQAQFQSCDIIAA
jgi:hypothetical protein